MASVYFRHKTVLASSQLEKSGPNRARESLVVNLGFGKVAKGAGEWR